MELRGKIARALAEWHGGPNAEPWVHDMYTEAADAVLAVLDLDTIRAEAEVEALREAADEAESREIVIHGSAHYDSDVLFSIRERADRIAREAGIKTGEKQ